MAEKNTYVTVAEMWDFKMGLESLNSLRKLFLLVELSTAEVIWF